MPISPVFALPTEIGSNAQIQRPAWRFRWNASLGWVAAPLNTDLAQPQRVQEPDEPAPSRLGEVGLALARDTDGVAIDGARDERPGGDPQPEPVAGAHLSD